MAIKGPIPMSMEGVFPSGAFVVGEVEAVSDFDAPQRPGGVRAQKLDKVSGLPMWAVPVIDGDETARGAAKSVKVNIVARVQPVPPPSLPGLPFRPVEFEGLTVTPYVSDSNGSRPRVAYSLRATGMNAPAKSSKAAPAA
ncbi:MAG: plasmid replication, integration and excision activator [Pseudonocardiales bacterium]|nr:MAG: plasmid replication, integration and excision activator [Pseudonocardiales bacterium]